MGPRQCAAFVADSNQILCPSSSGCCPATPQPANPNFFQVKAGPTSCQATAKPSFLNEAVQGTQVAMNPFQLDLPGLL